MPTNTLQPNSTKTFLDASIDQDAALANRKISKEKLLSTCNELIEHFEMTEEQAVVQLKIILSRLGEEDFDSEIEYLYTKLIALRSKPFKLHHAQIIELNAHANAENIYRTLISYIARFSILFEKGICISNISAFAMNRDDDDFELLLSNIEQLLSNKFMTSQQINELIKHKECFEILSLVMKKLPKLRSPEMNMTGEQLCLIAIKRNCHTLETRERENTFLTLQSLLDNFKKLLELGLSREQIFTIATYDNGYKRIDTAIKFLQKFSHNNTTDAAIVNDRTFTPDEVFAILANTHIKEGGLANLNAVYDNALMLFRLGMSRADIIKVASNSWAKIRFQTIITYHAQLTSTESGMKHIPSLNMPQILDMTFFARHFHAPEIRIKAFLKNREALLNQGYSIDQIVKISIADHEILPKLLEKHPQLITHGFTHDDIVLFLSRKKGLNHLELLSDRYQQLREEHRLSHETIVEAIRNKEIDDIELALTKKIPLLCNNDAAPIVDDKQQIEDTLLKQFGFNVVEDIAKLRKDNPAIGRVIIAIELAKRVDIDNLPSDTHENIGLTSDQLKSFLTEFQLIEKGLGWPVGKLQSIIRSLNLSTSEQMHILKNPNGLSSFKTLIKYTPELLSSKNQHKLSKENLLSIATFQSARLNIMELAHHLPRLLVTDDLDSVRQNRFTGAQLTLITGKNLGYLAIRYLVANYEALFEVLKTSENITKVMKPHCWNAIVTDILKHKIQLRNLGINPTEIVDIAAYEEYEKNISMLVEHFDKLDQHLRSIHPSAEIRKQKILAMLGRSSAKTRLDAFFKACETNPQQDAITSKKEHNIANKTIASNSDNGSQVATYMARTRRNREATDEINLVENTAITTEKASLVSKSTRIPQQVESNGSAVPYNQAVTTYDFIGLADTAGMDVDAYKAHYTCLVNEYQQTHEEAIDWLAQDSFYANMQRLTDNVDILTSSPINLSKSQALALTFLSYRWNIMPDIQGNRSGLQKLEQQGIKTDTIIMAILEERDRYDILTVLTLIDTLLNQFNFSSEDINQLLTAKTFDKKIPISMMKEICENLSADNAVLGHFTANQIVRIVVRSGERAQINLHKLIQCYDALSNLGFDSNQITKITASIFGDTNIREVIKFSGVLVGRQGGDDHPMEPGLGFSHDDVCAITCFSYSSVELNLHYVHKHAAMLLNLKFQKDDIVQMSNFRGSGPILNVVCERMGELQTFSTHEQIVAFVRKCKGINKDRVKKVNDLLALKSQLDDLGFTENQIKILAHSEDMYACFNAVVNLLPKLKSLGFSLDDIIIIALHNNPEENLNYVAMNYQDLRERYHISHRQFMNTIEKNPKKDVEDSIDASYECPKVNDLLLSHGFTQQQLNFLNQYDKRTCKLIARYLQQLLYQTNFPNGHHGLKLDISQLIRFAGVPRGSYNILAVMQYQYELLDSGKFSIEMLIKMASYHNGSNNLQMTVELYDELLDIGFSPDQITKIVGRLKGYELLHYLHAKQASLMKMFFSTEEITIFMCKQYSVIQTIVNNSDVLAQYFSATQILQLAEGTQASKNVEKLLNHIERLETLLQDRPVSERRKFMVDLACGPSGVSKIEAFLSKKDEDPNYNPSFFGRRTTSQRKNLAVSVDSAVAHSL